MAAAVGRLGVAHGVGHAGSDPLGVNDIELEPSDTLNDIGAVILYLKWVLIKAKEGDLSVVPWHAVASLGRAACVSRRARDIVKALFALVQPLQGPGAPSSAWPQVRALAGIHAVLVRAQSKASSEERSLQSAHVTVEMMEELTKLIGVEEVDLKKFVKYMAEVIASSDTPTHVSQSTVFCSPNVACKLHVKQYITRTLCI